MARILIDPNVELSAQLDSYKGNLSKPYRKLWKHNSYYIPEYPKILEPNNKVNILVDFQNKIITVEPFNLQIQGEYIEVPSKTITYAGQDNVIYIVWIYENNSNNPYDVNYSIISSTGISPYITNRLYNYTTVVLGKVDQVNQIVIPYIYPESEVFIDSISVFIPSNNHFTSQLYNYPLGIFPEYIELKPKSIITNGQYKGFSAQVDSYNPQDNEFIFGFEIYTDTTTDINNNLDILSINTPSQFNDVFAKPYFTVPDYTPQGQLTNVSAIFDVIIKL